MPSLATPVAAAVIVGATSAGIYYARKSGSKSEGRSLLSGLKKGARNTWTTASKYVGRLAFHIVAKWYQLRDFISTPKRVNTGYKLLPQSSPEGSTEPSDLMSDPEPTARQDMDYSSIKYARLKDATDTSCFADMQEEVVQTSSERAFGAGL